MFCRKLRKRSRNEHKKSINQHDAEKGPMSRHQISNVARLCGEGLNTMPMSRYQDDMVVT